MTFFKLITIYSNIIKWIRWISLRASSKYLVVVVVLLVLLVRHLVVVVVHLVQLLGLILL